jgi:protoheme IX farnesyltransferase
MLTKPVVVLLLLVTTLAAMIIAQEGLPDASLIAWTMAGGALTAGGASAINQYIDRDIDRKMSRTRERPIPRGTIEGSQVIIFGVILTVLGIGMLAVFVNPLSAFLALLGFAYYVFIYSILLKVKTPQNIVVGGGAGAIPPLVGWAAATGSLTIPAFFLFAVVFFWTPPHFWALALLKRREYARAGVPMFPVVYGEGETRSQIMLYTVQLVALTLLLPLADLGGWMFLLIAILLGAGLISAAWRLWRKGGNRLAWRMYRFSSSYLALIFIALVTDTLLSG